jgi:hypothetical protein
MRAELIQQMGRRTDEELFEMIFLHRDDWTPEAIDAAQSEWKNRALPREKIEKLWQTCSQKAQTEKAIAEQPLSWLVGVFFFLLGPIFCVFGLPQIVAAEVLYHQKGADQKYKDAWKFMGYGYAILIFCACMRAFAFLFRI